jgi:tRNA dimethylallyltransferase
MLYVRALLDGLSAMPAANAELRLAIETEAKTRGWPAMHAELARVDDKTAARLKPNDSQRIGRALEVYRASGVPMSDWHAHPKAADSAFGNMFQLGLMPANRALLHERIASRFDAMLSAGLVDEVRGLKARYTLTADLPSMRCVGYRQTWEYLEGSGTLDDLRDKGVAATRQLAKRQMTWMRAMHGLHTLDPFEPATERAVLERAAEFIGHALSG